MYQVNQIHLKYVDDLTIAESVDLKSLEVKPSDQRILPEDFHSRTGHNIITEKFSFVTQIDSIQNYANRNKMKVNLKKTKIILVNPSKTYDFLPNVKFQENEIESVEEIKLLGVVLRANMKWSTNTDLMTETSYKRLRVLCRLKGLGASDYDLLDIYFKQVRPVLENAVPVWHSAITQGECGLLEKVQKSALKIMLQEIYESYGSSLKLLKIQSLKERREKLCMKFALQAENHGKFSSWFKINNKKTSITRNNRSKYCQVYSRTKKFEKSKSVSFPYY